MNGNFSDSFVWLAQMTILLPIAVGAKFKGIYDLNKTS